MIKILNNKVCCKSLALISSDISNLNKQGLNLITTFELLQELDVNKKYKASLDSIKILIQQGESLEYAFNEYKELYPELFITFLALGEKYGKISEVMESMSIYYSQSDYVRKKFKEALSYPALIIICIVLLMVFLIFFMLPNLIKSINVDADSFTLAMKLMMYINMAVRENTIVFFSKIICWFIIIPIIIVRAKWRYIKEYVESKLKLTRMVNELTAITVLSIIYKSGIPLSIGLDLAIESLKNGSVRSTLEYIYLCILNGESIAETMNKTENFSSYTISMIKIGEECGTLENKLVTIENIMKEKIESYIKTFVSVIQPTMIFTMTGIILFFMVTCVLPIFSTMLGGIK